MTLAPDIKGIGNWLLICSVIGVLVGSIAGCVLHHLGLALACGTLGFLLGSRLIEWPFDDIIGLATVEIVRNKEGCVILELRTNQAIRDLEVDRRIYRFFQASIYLREAREAIANGRSRELISILLGLVILMFVVGYAFLSPEVPGHIAGVTEDAAGAARLHESRMAGEEAAWKVMIGLLPLFVHAVTLWVPLILQQARHQKL